jgi:hypothetical protein
MMKTMVTLLLLAAALALGQIGGSGSETVAFAASTFIGSTVLEIEPDGQKVTIRTNNGESLSLVVADPEMMKGVNKGDQVSLELGPDDRVNKIVKVETSGESARPREAPKGRSSESEY